MIADICVLTALGVALGGTFLIGRPRQRPTVAEEPLLVTEIEVLDDESGYRPAAPAVIEDEEDQTYSLLRYTFLGLRVLIFGVMLGVWWDE